MATDTEIKIRFLDGFDLHAWMADFVEPYYFSYEYYRRFGYFPFGDRPHGQFGTLQTYAELFGEADIVDTYRIIVGVLSVAEYRGHHPCLCGSNKKMRSCHGNKILPFLKDVRLISILKDDKKLIDKEIRILNEQYRRKAK